MPGEVHGNPPPKIISQAPWRFYPHQPPIGAKSPNEEADALVARFTSPLSCELSLACVRAADVPGTQGRLISSWWTLVVVLTAPPPFRQHGGMHACMHARYTLLALLCYRPKAQPETQMA